MQQPSQEYRDLLIHADNMERKLADLEMIDMEKLMSLTEKITDAAELERARNVLISRLTIALARMRSCVERLEKPPPQFYC
jgi:hypothetical protein